MRCVVLACALAVSRAHFLHALFSSAAQSCVARRTARPFGCGSTGIVRQRTPSCLRGSATHSPLCTRTLHSPSSLRALPGAPILRTIRPAGFDLPICPARTRTQTGASVAEKKRRLATRTPTFPACHYVRLARAQTRARRCARDGADAGRSSFCACVSASCCE